MAKYMVFGRPTGGKYNAAPLTLHRGQNFYVMTLGDGRPQLFNTAETAKRAIKRTKEWWANCDRQGGHFDLDLESMYVQRVKEY